MSMTEILDELPRLNDGERRAILHRLAELDPGIVLDETPEMLAAIDAGIRSMERGPGVPLAEARQPIAGGTARQSSHRSHRRLEMRAFSFARRNTGVQFHLHEHRET